MVFSENVLFGVKEQANNCLEKVVIIWSLVWKNKWMSIKMLREGSEGSDW